MLVRNRGPMVVRADSGLPRRVSTAEIEGALAEKGALPSEK